MAGPLSGVKVLDLSRILAGPWAGQVLADLGADVIKIERPGSGDDTRSWGPPYLRDQAGNDTSESAYFLAANRGKRSAIADISTREGQRLVTTLAANSDILLENYKVGGLRQYGLDYESLKQHNPSLIYCSISGFGQTGPLRDRGGYDFLIQGLTGLMSITGESERGPLKVGVAVSDVLSGLYAVIAILGALHHRQSSGVGQHIDIALFDVQMAALANQAMNYLVSGEAPGRMGNAHPNIVPYQSFEASDGHFIVAVGNDRQFETLCDALERPDLAADPRYAKNADRVIHRESIVASLQECFRGRKASEWIERLESRGIACGPIASIAEAFANPQTVARGLLLHLPHAQAETVPLVANPIKYSSTPIEYRLAPPMLGEHTAEIQSLALKLDRSIGATGSED